MCMAWLMRICDSLCSCGPWVTLMCTSTDGPSAYKWSNTQTYSYLVKPLLGAKLNKIISHVDCIHQSMSMLWQKSNKNRGSRHLEQTANWRRRCRFTVNFSSTVRTFFIPTIISWCSLLTSPNQWSLQWLCHLSHFKNWLIDWKCYLTAANAKTLSFWPYKIYIAQIGCVLNMTLLYTRKDTENSINPPHQKCCICVVARESCDSHSQGSVVV